jgi:hypothetical protein
MYNYRDFSSVDDEELEAETQGSAPASPPPCPEGGMQNSIRVQKFQVKLYAILAQKDFHEIITWMPHGRSWKVLKPHLFESHVMPLFFEYSNYHSFNRLVNAWSFRRITSGLDRGSYYHEVSVHESRHDGYIRTAERKLIVVFSLTWNYSCFSAGGQLCRSTCADSPKPTRNCQ